MTTITASMVGALRAKTDAPMMECKKALTEADGDMERAEELLRVKLGSVAGNLALTLGARGGVYIGGGVVPQLGDSIIHSRFRERFEAKGRFRPYLSQIPTWVITAADDTPALRGANRALDR